MQACLKAIIFGEISEVLAMFVNNRNFKNSVFCTRPPLISE
jgi:hypothetical protein